MISHSHFSRIMAEVPLSRVRAMLLLFPLDGLRKATLTCGLHLPLPEKETKEALVDALLDGLAADTLRYRKASVDAESMWQECQGKEFGHVVITDDMNHAKPELTALMKRDLASCIEMLLNNLGGVDAIDRVCAGKASSASKTAEKSALCKRWRARYGQPEHAYTHMRRLYADKTSGTDYKAREALALEVEKHAFDVLRRLLGPERAATLIEFSDEAGRQNTGKSTGPQWKVFVYLALRIKNPKEKKV